MFLSKKRLSFPNFIAFEVFFAFRHASALLFGRGQTELHVCGTVEDEDGSAFDEVGNEITVPEIVGKPFRHRP